MTISVVVLAVLVLAVVAVSSIRVLRVDLRTVTLTIPPQGRRA